ncbi:MAG TPA: hypothetical protein VGQ99_20350, partial [Tepidisphaeraceae bacterium]|nr:hypothetical protein [Tepidisphaeraceae bacterium]
MFKPLLLILLPLSLLIGCAETTPDTNTQVFQTVDEVAAARRAQQQKDWKAAAIDVLHEERPDISATPDTSLAIILTADGIRDRLDLSELAPTLTAQPDQIHAILREQLLRQLIPFDQERLARASFQDLRKRIRPMLFNGADVQELSTQLGSQLPTRTIFADLYWLPVIRWDAPRPATPIGPKPLASWKIPNDEINQLALANLATDPVEGTFDVTAFGALGRILTLKPTTDPAILLSPNFLPTARRALQTTDNLALLLATPNDVRFVESQNKKLLDSLYPGWKHIITNNRKALARQPLLLSESG